MVQGGIAHEPRTQTAGLPGTTAGCTPASLRLTEIAGLSVACSRAV